MISTDTSTATGVLTSSTQTIVLGFYFMANTDLVVTRTRAGVITTLTLDSDYSIAGAGHESGGSITVTGQASGDVITIVRTVPYTQLVDLVPLTKLSETLLERALDKLTMLCQQLKRSVDASGLLPTRIASTALGVDGAGNWIQRSASELFTFLKTYGGFFGTTSGTVAAGDHNHAGVYATAAQGAKADSAVQPTRTVNGHALSADVTVTKGDVVLGNCDNTSDANKPVSTAQATAITAQVFAAVALTNPYSATTPIVPRRIGDMAINTTTSEMWEAKATEAATTSWQCLSLGVYGGIVLDDVHAFNRNGPFSALSTAANAPTSTENCAYLQTGSNLGATSCILKGYGLTTGTIWAQSKVAGTWGAWSNGVTWIELSKLAGIGATTVKAQLDAKAPLASPALTGTPTVPTATAGTNTTQAASTAFAVSEVATEATARATGDSVLTPSSLSAAYTLVLTDAGKCLVHPAADTTARAWTIPANASVAFAVGTVITIANTYGAGILSLGITTDTLYLAGSSLTGTRSISSGGLATLIKVAATTWMISGAGVS